MTAKEGKKPTQKGHTGNNQLNNGLMAWGDSIWVEEGDHLASCKEMEKKLKSMEGFRIKERRVNKVWKLNWKMCS